MYFSASSLSAALFSLLFLSADVDARIQGRQGGIGGASALDTAAASGVASASDAAASASGAASNAATSASGAAGSMVTMSGSSVMAQTTCVTMMTPSSGTTMMTAASTGSSNSAGPSTSAITTGNGGGGQGTGGGAGGDIPNANAGTQAHGSTRTVATSSSKGGAVPTGEARARAVVVGVAGLLGGLVL